ncbi:uncharacterized protein [Acropora muricata]|uniref:uncharacterized protein isoform X3 n=1 Tax=Acropora muricata TaxID=159855 RepID=UPI0034E5F07F
MYTLFSIIQTIHFLRFQICSKGKEMCIKTRLAEGITSIQVSVAQVSFPEEATGACLLLQLSICKRNRLLVLPYLVLNVILLGYNLGVVIYYIVVWKLISLIIFIAISWAFSIYFLIVVYSFHEALREDPSGVTAGFLVNNPTGSAPNANYAV